jgi:hypothetical protein
VCSSDLIQIFIFLFAIQTSFTQRFDWVSSGGYAFNTSSDNGAIDVARDSDGNLYVANRGNGDMQCQGDTIFSSPGSSTRTFIYKFNPDGNLLFMKVIGNSNFPRNLETDEWGNLYVLIAFTSSVCELPDDTTFSVQLGTNYVLKFDRDFKFIWAFNAGFPVQSSTNMLQYANASIYVQNGSTRIARIDTSGQELSSVSALYNQNLTAIPGIEFAGSSAFPNGDVIFAANSRSRVSYVEGDTLIPSSNVFLYTPHLLLRCDSNLNVIWAKYFGNFRSHDGFYLPVDVGTDEQIYVIGQVNDTLIVQSDTIIGNPSSVGMATIYKVSSEGEGVWARALGNVHQVQPRFIVNEPNGSGLFSCGVYSGILEAPGYNLDNTKGTAYIAKYDYDGHLTNLFNFTGTSNTALCLAADNHGSYYVGGISSQNPIPVFSCEPRTPNTGFYLARFTEEPDEAPQPTISVEGNVLTANPNFSGTIQWFLNGEEIPGANGQTYTAIEDGAYSVSFSYESGCISTAESEVSTVVISGIAILQNRQLEIFPNPANEAIFIKPLSNDPILITDLSGKQLLNFQIINTEILSIDISNLKSGVYLIRQGNVFGKMIKP